MGVPAALITNVYNGTDTTKFQRTAEMATEAKVRYPLNEADYVVGCIGSTPPRSSSTAAGCRTCTASLSARGPTSRCCST